MRNPTSHSPGVLPVRPSAWRLALAASCCALALGVPVSAQAESKIKPHPDGFWKIHPPNNFKREFGGEDVIGLANHQHIPTDCSIAWKNKQKFYCFSSQMSSQFVQESPNDYLPQAEAFWKMEHPQQSTEAKPDANAVASGPQQGR